MRKPLKLNAIDMEEGCIMTLFSSNSEDWRRNHFELSAKDAQKIRDDTL